MNANAKIDLEARMKMAVALIELLHKRVDGLTDEIEMLRSKVNRKRRAFIRRTPADAAAERILSGVIMEAVAKTGIAAEMICSDVRVKGVVAARQWVMYEACVRGLGYAQIGRLMNRDHSTVIHAVSVEAARRAG